MPGCGPCPRPARPARRRPCRDRAVHLVAHCAAGGGHRGGGSMQATRRRTRNSSTRPEDAGRRGSPDHTELMKVEEYAGQATGGPCAEQQPENLVPVFAMPRRRRRGRPRRRRRPRPPAARCAVAAGSLPPSAAPAAGVGVGRRDEGARLVAGQADSGGVIRVHHGPRRPRRGDPVHQVMRGAITVKARQRRLRAGCASRRGRRGGCPWRRGRFRGLRVLRWWVAGRCSPRPGWSA